MENGLVQKIFLHSYLIVDIPCYDLEDAHMAEAAYARFKASGKKGIPLEEVERRLGLADCVQPGSG
jgi:hypothetical protein